MRCGPTLGTLRDILARYAKGARDVTESNRELLRPAEAAEMLSMSRSKVYALVSNGRLPAVRAMGSVRIPRRALVEWIDRQTVTPIE